MCVYTRLYSSLCFSFFFGWTLTKFGAPMYRHTTESATECQLVDTADEEERERDECAHLLSIRWPKLFIAYDIEYDLLINKCVANFSSLLIFLRFLCRVCFCASLLRCSMFTIRNCFAFVRIRLAFVCVCVCVVRWHEYTCCVSVRHQNSESFWERMTTMSSKIALILSIHKNTWADKNTFAFNPPIDMGEANRNDDWKEWQKRRKKAIISLRLGLDIR